MEFPKKTLKVVKYTVLGEKVEKKKEFPNKHLRL